MTHLPDGFTSCRIVTWQGDVVDLRMISGNLRWVVNGEIVPKGGDVAHYLKRPASE